MSPLARAHHPHRIPIQNHLIKAGEPVPPADMAEALGMATSTVLYHLRVLVAADAPIAYDARGRVRWVG